MRTTGTPVYRLDSNMNVIDRWDSMKRAGEQVKTTGTKIKSACQSGELLMNFYWRFALDIEVYPDEEWRLAPFPEFEPLYASSHGRIRKENGHIIKSTLINGYPTIRIFRRNSTERATRETSRIVAATFFGRHDDLIVNHLDGDTINDNVSNLEYTTPMGNVIHAIENGLVGPPKPRRCPVKQYSNGIEIARFDSIKEASEKTGVSTATIRRYCNIHNSAWNADTWRYVEPRI